MENPNLYSALRNVDNLPQAQQNVFVPYRGNYFLERAIDGNESLEFVVKELAKPFVGKLQLPHMKNKEHNQKVRTLGDLIPVGGLCTKGIYVPDNPLTGLTYLALGLAGVSAIPHIDNLGLRLFIGVTSLLGGSSAMMSGIFYSRNLQDTLMAAIYVDSCIKEFGIK